MRINAEAIRPGATFQAWETVWRVTENDTLNRILTIYNIKRTTDRKRVRYQPGQLINCRTIRYTRI